MKIKTYIISFLILTSSIAYAKSNPAKEANKLLDSVRKDLTSLSADFVQYEIDINGNNSEKQFGKVWLSSPNKFKWQYIKPMPQLIIASGEKIWIYDEDLEQVTIKKQQNKHNPIYVLLNKEQTENNYNISLIVDENKTDTSTQWVQMTPKNESEDVKVVWLGINDNNLTALKLQNQLDNIVVFEFNNFIKNSILEDGFFNFNIPKGTDVIEEKIEFGEF